MSYLFSYVRVDFVIDNIFYWSFFAVCGPFYLGWVMWEIWLFMAYGEIQNLAFVFPILILNLAMVFPLPNQI